MAQNSECDHVTFLIGPTLWPKTRFVTLSHSLLGQLYGPNRDSVTLSHSLLGQLYGPEYRLQNALQRQKMALFQLV